MNCTPELSIVIPPDVMIREIDGQSFVLNIQTGCYFGLDPVGTRMLEVLGNNVSVGAALAQLQAEYDVDPGTLRADLERLVGDLLQHGLVETKEVTPPAHT
jgi:hypothetical protein